jgi:hypothetical protein
MNSPTSSSSKELLIALQKVIREESGKPAAPPEPSKPNYRTVAVVVLVGINIALTLTLFEQVLKENKIVEVTMKVIPFLFGAAFVALLDDFRHYLLRLSSRRQFEWLMLGVLLLVVSAHIFLVIPGLVHIRAATAAELRLDGEPIGMGPDSIYIAPIVGLKRHELVINETLTDDLGNQTTTADTVFLGLRDRLRVMFPARLLLKRGDSIVPESLYPVAIEWPEARTQALQLRISGTLSDKAIARIDALGLMQLEQHTDTPSGSTSRSTGRRVSLVSTVGRDDAFPTVHLPVGSYTFTIEGRSCGGGSGRLMVTASWNVLRVPNPNCPVLR